MRADVKRLQPKKKETRGGRWGSHHVRLVITDCIVIQNEKPPLPTFPLKVTYKNRQVTSTPLSSTPVMGSNQLRTHHIALFDAVAAPQHARPVALPVSPFWFFSVILKGFVITVSVLSPTHKTTSFKYVTAPQGSRLNSMLHCLIKVSDDSAFSLKYN